MHLIYSLLLRLLGVLVLKVFILVAIAAMIFLSVPTLAATAPTTITTDKVYYINGTDTVMRINISSSVTTEVYNTTLTRPDGSIVTIGNVTYNSSSGFYDANYTFNATLDNMPGDYKIEVNTSYINYTSFLYMPVQGMNNIGVLTSRAQIWYAYKNDSLVQLGFGMHELMKEAGFKNSYLLSPGIVESQNLSNFSAIIVSYLPSELWTTNLTNKLQTFSNSGGILVLFGNLSSNMSTYAGVTYNSTLPTTTLFNLTRTSMINNTIVPKPWLDTNYFWSSDMGYVDGDGRGNFSFNLSASFTSVVSQSVNDWPLDLYNTSAGVQSLYNLTDRDGHNIGAGLVKNKSVIYSPLPLSDLIGEADSWAYGVSTTMYGDTNHFSNFFIVFQNILAYELEQKYGSSVKSWFYPNNLYDVVLYRSDDDYVASLCTSWQTYGIHGTWITYTPIDAAICPNSEAGIHIVHSYFGAIGVGSYENSYGETIYTQSDHGDGTGDYGMNSLLNKMKIIHWPGLNINGYQVEGSHELGRFGEILQDPLFLWWNDNTSDVTFYPRLRIIGYDNTGGFEDATKSYDFAWYRRHFSFVQLAHGSFDANLINWVTAFWNRTSNGGYTHHELADWYDQRDNVTFYITTQNTTHIIYNVSSPVAVQNFTWVVSDAFRWNVSTGQVLVDDVDVTSESGLHRASLYGDSRKYMMFITNLNAGQTAVTFKIPSTVNDMLWRFNDVNDIEGYSLTVGPSFEINWVDTSGGNISKVFIETNISGSPVNYSATLNS